MICNSVDEFHELVKKMIQEFELLPESTKNTVNENVVIIVCSHD